MRVLGIATLIIIGCCVISYAIFTPSTTITKPTVVEVVREVKVPMTHKEQRSYEDSILQGCVQVPDKNDEVVGFQCGKVDITIPESSLEHLLMEYYHPECCYS